MDGGLLGAISGKMGLRCADQQSVTIAPAPPEAGGRWKVWGWGDAASWARSAVMSDWIAAAASLAGLVAAAICLATLSPKAVAKAWASKLLSLAGGGGGGAAGSSFFLKK